MKYQRLTFIWDIRWRNRWKLSVFILSVIIHNAVGWEEGDDAVNVISVENMDALLGLRMVTELKSFEGLLKANKNETTESRSKRMATKDSTRDFEQMRHLCRSKDCHCNNVGNGYLNVTCDFKSEGVIHLGKGSLPEETGWVTLNNAKALTILPGIALKHPILNALFFHNIESLTIKSGGFQNSTQFPLTVEIKDCGNVTLEDRSFRSLELPVHVTIKNCDQVILKNSVFFALKELQAINVRNLVLSENAFSVELKKSPIETELLFHNVSANEILNGTFPLSKAKIRIVDSFIRTIRSGAFKGIELGEVEFTKARVHRLEKEAFSKRTLINDLKITNSHLGFIDAKVVTAADKFTLQNCSVEEITSGAFNLSTAVLKILHNNFQKIRTHAFEVSNWNVITIEGNRFKSLEPNFFQTLVSGTTNQKNRFQFTNNYLPSTEVDVLTFLPKEEGLDVQIYYNMFEELCHCGLNTSKQKHTPGEWETLYETSYCVISERLERCYNLTRGYLYMKDYAEKVCTPENQVICEDIIHPIRPNVLEPVDLQNTERTLIGVIFLGVVCSTAIMLTILSLIWMKKKGVCGRKGKPSTSGGMFSVCLKLCNNGTLVTTNSISRINIHEYAEIQNQMNQQQKHIILAVEEHSDQEEELVVYENKATQTLPEELTQELLQSLREKLDDPNNYNEARDMIEHLYDLIKVEESCNNNDNPSPLFADEEEEEEEQNGLYEVISMKKSSLSTRSSKNKKKPFVNVISTGTRVPSPDKLSPMNFTLTRPLPTIVNDYTEPRDRKSNEYSEIPPPGSLIMPDVLPREGTDLSKIHIYAEPLPRRPLPGKPEQAGTSYS